MLTSQGLNWATWGRGWTASDALLCCATRTLQTFEIIPADEIGVVVVIPIGHTEQHGHHLPLSTDTPIIDAIARAWWRPYPIRLHVCR
jgi:hypothetical protein